MEQKKGWKQGGAVNWDGTALIFSLLFKQIPPASIWVTAVSFTENYLRLCSRNLDLFWRQARPFHKYTVQLNGTHEP